MIVAVSTGIYHEMNFFLAAIITGAVLMLLNDVLKLVRAAIPHHRFVVAAEDMLFWFAAAVAVFFTAFAENDGLVRGFLGLGIFSGASLFQITFGKIFKWIQKKIPPKHKKKLKKPGNKATIGLCKLFKGGAYEQKEPSEYKE